MNNILEKHIHNWTRENRNNPAIYDEKTEIFALEYDQRFYTSLEDSLNGQGFHLYSVIGKVSTEMKNEIALEALKANLFGRETGHSSIGYDDETETLILFKNVSYEGLTDASFTENLNEFLAYRIYWEKKFSEIKNTKIEMSETSSSSIKNLMIGQKMNVYFA
jgi:Tir chaperone protein (CesT) family